jgi:hypothetical protein
MSLDGEMLPVHAEARQECVGGHEQAEAPRAAFARGLRTIFGAVIDASAGSDEHVPDGRELGNLGFRCWVAAQPVGDDLARYL